MEIFLKIRKTCYRGRSPQLEVFHEGVFTSQKQTVQLTCLGAAAPRGCGEQMVPMGKDLGWAGMGMQTTGQVISKVFVMSWCFGGGLPAASL